MTGGGRIIALGGGDIAEADTRSIDEHIVAVAPGSDPEALFIPTASGDDEEYITTFTEYYTELGCTVHTLRLTDPDVTPADTRIVNLIHLMLDNVMIGHNLTQAYSNTMTNGETPNDS